MGAFRVALIVGVLACAAVAEETIRLQPPVENWEVTRPLLSKLFQAQKQRSEAGATRFLARLSSKASFVQGTADIAKLTEQMSQGGLEAGKAIAQLLELASSPEAIKMMKDAGALRRAAALMQSESSSDAVKASAGSLITRATNYPVSASVSDVSTGSYGHVTIVLPSPDRIYGRH